MPAGINLKLLNLKLIASGVPEEIKSSIVEEVRLLKELPWLTPKVIVKAPDIKRLSFETLRNFKIQDPKTKKFTYKPASFLLGGG